MLAPSTPKRDSSVSQVQMFLKQYVPCSNSYYIWVKKSTVGWWYPPIQRDQRENNTPARKERVAMETREKSVLDVMQENLLLVKSGVSF